MNKTTNRRQWLQRAGLSSAGFLLAPAIASQARPQTSAKTWSSESRVWERNLTFTPEMNGLKARLLANENPYGPSDKAKVAMMEAISDGNRYQHADAARLKAMLAEREGVTTDHIILGPGSTDLLEKVAITQFLDGGNVVSADPAYMALIKTALAFRAEWRNVPLTKDWAHDLDAMYKAIDSDTRLVYICNPNNPTGSLTDSNALRAFCRKAAKKTMVFVDEAYLEFLAPDEQDSMVDLVGEGHNIIVTRTFSKIHAMAGLRVGYSVGLPETLEAITAKVRDNMGLNVSAIRGAMASLEDETFLTNSRNWTRETRAFTFDSLKALGYAPIPSYTSFMLFPLLPETDGKAYLEQMYGQGVGVRVFELDDKPWCRVSMGTMPEMQLFVESFKRVAG
jgi:histidinol-phosphate aminotransferase